MSRRSMTVIIIEIGSVPWRMNKIVRGKSRYSEVETTSLLKIIKLGTANVICNLQRKFVKLKEKKGKKVGS
ncbi:predicted protein [Sclerotinia sclerotiorum 1980 UF-70]|uniref:Uncharacterized protein n=1 Tax=Sclerotinia sclerotiorum (strain ATCC 18683 / 1980 / Ss-1) TaxID=665079 RepID=A7E7G4_SCLS1|nr:predicted protein [Sclerotinia sclerotiorum 1980 UF-70]EDN96316.1 predicted protein [Sclerotinia sclerotiorum 1980 UF-70]